MKIYFSLIFIAALNIAVFGFVAPALISDDSTESVLLGILAIIILLPVDVMLVKSIFKKGESK